MDEKISAERQWIHDYAQSARTAARQILTWQLDRLRLYVGLVEIVPRDEDPEPGTCRMIPTGRDEYGQNWCVLVRDVPQPDPWADAPKDAPRISDDERDDLHPTR